MRLSLQTVEEVSGLRAVREEWTSLLDSAASNHPFLTWEWVSTWWDVYGSRRRLHVLVARDDSGRMVGLAPLQLWARRLLGVRRFTIAEFLGAGGDVTSDRLDFVIRPGLEHAVSELFVRHLAESPAIDAFDLRPFAGDAPALAECQSWLMGQRGQVTSQVESVCPIVRLPDTWPAFMAGRSKNYRKKMGEYERRCERDYRARWRVSDSTDSVAADLETLAVLHRRRWDGRSRAFATPEYMEFHRRLVTLFFGRGWIRLFAMENDSGPIAMLYCFAYNKRYYFYQAGRDPAYARHRAGLVLLHKAIRHAVSEGAELFDFLRGGEDYKYLWAGEDLANARLRYWKSFGGLACGKLLGLTDRAVSYGRRTIARGG